MDKREIIRRLRSYLPRYVNHSDRVHWIGPLPVVDRALIMFEGQLWEETDTVNIVDLANVVWVPGGCTRYGFLLNLLHRKEFGSETNIKLARRAQKRASHPQSRLLRLSSWDSWPPSVVRLAEEAGPAPPFSWMVLWSHEAPDWERALDQFDQDMLPSRPDLEWLAPWEAEFNGSNRYGHLYQEVSSAIWGSRELDLPSFWVDTVIDVVCSWYDAPRVIRDRLLPQSELIQGLERAARELGQRVNDEEVTELFLVELDEVSGYLLQGRYLGQGVLGKR